MADKVPMEGGGSKGIGEWRINRVAKFGYTVLLGRISRGSRESGLGLNGI